jgi:alpha-glucosidase
VFRDHSARDTPRAEPWVDGPAQLAIRRRFVEERYRLMPYIYALADENARTGDPLMRPVFYDYPDAASAPCDQAMTFTLGRALLIAPPAKMESPQPYDVCLPGGAWYDYWTGARVGSAKITEKPSLDRLPVFVRAGTILPRQPLVQSTSETPNGPLSIDVYPGPDCRGIIYLDDGHSMAFEQGHYLRQLIECSTENGELRLTLHPRQGDYAPWWKQLRIVVHDRSARAQIRSPVARIERIRSADPSSLEFLMPDAPMGAGLEIAGK